MYERIITELRRNGLSVSKMGFEEICAIHNTNLLKDANPGKSFKVNLGKKKIDAMVYLTPIYKHGNKVDGVSPFRMICYTDALPELVCGIFDVRRISGVVFLHAKSIRATSFESDMADLVKDLRDKYKWHLS